MDDKNVAYLKNLFAPDEKKKVKSFWNMQGNPATSRIRITPAILTILMTI